MIYTCEVKQRTPSTLITQTINPTHINPVNLNVPNWLQIQNSVAQHVAHPSDLNLAAIVYNNKCAELMRPEECETVEHGSF